MTTVTINTATETKTSPVSISPIGMIHVEIAQEVLDKKYRGCGEAFAAVSPAGVVGIEYIKKPGQKPSRKLVGMGKVYRGMLSCCRFCIE